MRKAILFLITTLFIAYGCEPKESKLLLSLEILYDYVLKAELDQIYPLLDQESQVLVDKFTNPANQSADSLFLIGNRYRIPYLAFQFYADFTNPPITDRSDFFIFLLTRNVGIFDSEHYLEPIEEQMVQGSEAALPLGFLDQGQKKLRWTSFTQTEEQEYRYNLLYSMQLDEKKAEQIYKELQIGSGLDKDAYLRKLFDETGRRSRSKNREAKLLDDLKKLKMKPGHDDN